MAFTNDQLSGLNAAYERKQKGNANPSDLDNLNYAQSKGYKYQPPVSTPALPKIPSTVPASDISLGMENIGTTPPAQTFPSLYESWATGSVKTTEDLSKNLMTQFDTQKKELDTMKADMEKARAEAQKAQEGAVGDYQATVNNNEELDAFKSVYDMQSLYADQKAQFDERKKLTDEHAQLVTAMNQDILAEKQRPMSMSARALNLQNVQEDYVSKINSIEAQFSILDGNYNMASNIINQGINLIQTKRQDTLNYYKWVEGIYDAKEKDASNSLINIDAKEKANLQSQMEIIQNQIKTTEENKKAMINLFTDEKTRDLAVKSNVQITDAPEIVSQKIADYLEKNPDYGLEIDYKNKGYKYVSTPSELTALKQQGRQFVIVNGRTYVAPLATGSGVITSKETDAYGNVTVVGVDKATGQEMYRTDLGQIGKGFKATSGGGRKSGGGSTSTTGGGNTTPQVAFTPSEKKKLEQAGLSSSDRQKQLDYLYGNSSKTTGNSNMSKLMQDELITMKTVEDLTDQILNYNSDGKLEGIGYGTGWLKAIAGQFGLSSDEAKNVRILIGNIKGSIAKLRGGTSFTPNEEALLNTYTPSINDNPNVAISKLNMLKDFIAKKRQNTHDIMNNVQSAKPTNKVEDLRKKYNY